MTTRGPSTERRSNRIWNERLIAVVSLALVATVSLLPATTAQSPVEEPLSDDLETHHSVCYQAWFDGYAGVCKGEDQCEVGVDWKIWTGGYVKPC